MRLKCTVLCLLALVLTLAPGMPAQIEAQGCMLDTPPSAAATSDGYFDWPLARPDGTGELGFGHDVRVQQNYGNTDNTTSPGTPHTGMDLQWLPRAGESYGTNTVEVQVHAASSGEVFCVGHGWGAQGWVVVVRHALADEDDVFTLYGHLNPPALACGQRVERGQEIGSVQSWPNDPSNTHLHYEVRRFGESTDENRPCAGPGYWARPEEKGWVDPVDFYYKHRPRYPRPVVTFGAAGRFLRSDPAEGAGEMRDRGGNVLIVPPSTRLTASDVRHDENPELNRWWYRVRHGGRRGWINGYLWQSEKNSTLAIGEPARLGPDWTRPRLRPAIRYHFDDPAAFITGVAPNSGWAGPSRDGLIRGDARLAEGSNPGTRFNYSVELDGDSGFVETGNSEGITWFERGLVVEASIWRQANVDEDAIVAKWYGGDQWLLTIYPVGNGLLIFSVRLEDGTYASVEYLIPDTGYLGRWARVAARANPRGWLQLYWEGRLVAEKRLDVSRLRLAPSRSPIHVGDAGNEVWWSSFRGRIDDVRIWAYRPFRRWVDWQPR